MQLENRLIWLWHEQSCNFMAASSPLGYISRAACPGNNHVGQECRVRMSSLQEMDNDI